VTGAVAGGRGRDFCVATDDDIGGIDVANCGPGQDVYDADAGDTLVSVETFRDCRTSRCDDARGLAPGAVVDREPSLSQS
jgi:hypothetical protein